MKIWQIIKKNIGIISVLSIVALLSNIAKILAPFFLQHIIENFNDFSRYLIVFLLLVILGYASQILFEYFLKKFSVFFMTNENLELMNLMYTMDYAKIEEYEPTYLVDRQSNAVAYIFKLISTNISEIIGGLLSIIAIIVLMSNYNMGLTACYVLYASISFFGYKIINKQLISKSVKVQRIVSSNYKNILSFMTNVDYIKMLPEFNMVGKYLKRLFKSTAEENAGINFFAAGISTVLDLILEIMQSAIYIITFYLAYIGEVEFAQVATIVVLNNIFRNSMKTLNTTNIGLRDVKASIKYINETLIDNQETSDGTHILKDITSIYLEAQNIHYGGDTYIESGIIKANKGDFVGIVGASGTGKSTLIKVLLGLKKDTGSKILFNDIDINLIDQYSIKQNTRYVSQTKSVFPITLQENLLFGMTEQEINSEVVRVAIDELLEEKWFEKFAVGEKGLNIEILEGAANLSGGDQQKISIGRVIINPCNLLILDEFTNSIDKNAEQQIMSKLKDRYKDKIIILITHDEELLTWCNKVYSIENRQIVELK